MQWKETLSPINDTAPVWNNREAQNFIQTLCDQMRLNYGLPRELGPNCKVFASLTPNAFSYPGGDIFITAGLLGVLPNVDTLMFFLGHEYSHIIARHTTKKMNKQDFMADLYSTLSIVSNVAALAPGPNVVQLATAMGVREITMQSIQVSTQALLTVHQRRTEEEADALGLEIALSLGADRDKIIEGLEALERYCDDTFKKNPQDFINHFMTADYAGIQERMTLLQRTPAPAMIIDVSTKRTAEATYEKLFKNLSRYSNYYRLQMK